MGIEVFTNAEHAVLVGTDDGAFGPVITMPEDAPEYGNIMEYVAGLLEWLPEDPRTYDANVLEEYVILFAERCRMMLRCATCPRFVLHLNTYGMCNHCVENEEELPDLRDPDRAHDDHEPKRDYDDGS